MLMSLLGMYQNSESIFGFLVTREYPFLDTQIPLAKANLNLMNYLKLLSYSFSEDKRIIFDKYNICLPLKPFHCGLLLHRLSAATFVGETPDCKAFA